MLSDHSHVKIGTVTYLLAEKQDMSHYQHLEQRFPLFRNRPLLGETDIQGESINKRQVLPERLLWALTDFSGGEGNKVYYDDDPTVYDKSVNLNSRIPGQLQPRPKRDRDSITADDVTKPCYLQAGGTYLWLGGGQKMSRNPDGSYNSWTAKNPTLPAGHFITALAGDSTYIYATSSKGVTSDRLIFRSGDNGTTYNSVSTADMSTVETSKNPITSMAVFDGRLYTFDGGKFQSYDVSSSLPRTAKALYDTGVVPTNSSMWTNLIDCGNSIVFLVSVPGKVQMFQMKENIVNPLWSRDGLTIKSSTYQDGILYCAGYWGASGSGLGVLWGLPLDSLRPMFLGYFRKTSDQSLQMQSMGGMMGNNIMINAGLKGKMFIYNGDFDSISMVDDLGGNDGTSQELGNETGSNLVFSSSNKERISDCTTFGNYRVYAIFNDTGTGASTTYQTLHYKDDEPTNRMTTATNMNWYWESPEHDFDHPYDTKLLVGVYVTFQVEDNTTISGLKANQRIRIRYAKDDGSVSPTYTTIGTIDNNTTPTGTKGRVFIQVATDGSCIFFQRLKFKVFLDNNSTAGVQPPILLSLTGEAMLTSYEETWDLIVRTRNDNMRTRPSVAQFDAEQRRDNLDNLFKTGCLTTLLDGYRSKTEGEYTTHTVRVEIFQDSIMRHAEGECLIRLRAVPPST